MSESAEMMMKELRSRGVREVGVRTLVGLVAYGIPAVMLSRYLARLTEGALWVPTQWRGVVLSLGFLGGAACFSLARLNVRSRFVVRPINCAESPGRAGMRDFEDRQHRLSRNRSAMFHCLAWLGVTLVCLASFALMKAVCVIEWRPPEAVALNVFEETLPANTVFASAGASHNRRVEYDRGSAFVERRAGAFEGSLLVPLGFPWSKECVELLDQTRRHFEPGPGTDLLRLTLDRNPVELIDTVKTSEAFPLGLTRTLFVIVHILLLLSASLSFGYAYSRLEEVANFMVAPLIA